MVISAKDMSVFENLKEDEMVLVSSYASSLIRNRSPHTDAYNKFQEARQRMLKNNPMDSEQIDAVIHGEEH